MNFKLLNTTSLPLDRQLQWLWYSPSSSGFITGDDKKSFTLPVANLAATSPLQSAPPTAVCNLPIPAALYDEFASIPRHGFRFLVSAETPPKDGDLLRQLVFGPSYGHCVRHPASNLVISLNSGSLELFEQTGNAFKSLDKTKNRGKAALAFAAHPTESTIAYGDNFGTFHLHHFDNTGFGKAAKIVAKDRKASRIEFSAASNQLLLGGMGYLASFSHTNGKTAPLHEIPISVRDFLWLEPANLILVNQGMHGVAAYRCYAAGFTKLAEIKSANPVNQIAVSPSGQYLALSYQDSSNISVYEVID